MTSHTTIAIRVVAVTSATGLVIASAGFGGVFAYKVGVQHSILLAGLTVLMALALRGCEAARHRCRLPIHRIPQDRQRYAACRAWPCGGGLQPHFGIRPSYP